MCLRKYTLVAKSFFFPSHHWEDKDRNMQNYNLYFRNSEAGTDTR